MNEREWLAHTDPNRMLDYLEVYHKVARTKKGGRKLRLVACACWRGFDRFRETEKADSIIELAERYAEGALTLDEVRHAIETGWQYPQTALSYVRPKLFEYTPQLTARAAVTFFRNQDGADILREVFGNPFRPFHITRIPGHLVELANQCDAALPVVSDEYLILADALDDLGEEAAALHCREPIHFKGCFALDWILGKG